MCILKNLFISFWVIIQLDCYFKLDCLTDESLQGRNRSQASRVETRSCQGVAFNCGCNLDKISLSYTLLNHIDSYYLNRILFNGNAQNYPTWLNIIILNEKIIRVKSFPKLTIFSRIRRFFFRFNADK